MCSRRTRHITKEKKRNVAAESFASSVRRLANFSPRRDREMGEGRGTLLLSPSLGEGREGFPHGRKDPGEGKKEGGGLEKKRGEEMEDAEAN